MKTYNGNVTQNFTYLKTIYFYLKNSPVTPDMIFENLLTTYDFFQNLYSLRRLDCVADA